MSLAKNLLVWFVSGLCVATGSKLGEYFAKELTTGRPNPSGPFPGFEARELCPQCGRSLMRFAKTLYCPQCGYREG